MRLATFLFCLGALQAQQRIVSTSPAITETLFAAGAGNRVVGISNYCHFPPEAISRPRVGSYLRPNIEAIVRLKPDLVIVEKLPNNAIEQLAGARIRVEVITPGTLEENLRLMEKVSAVVGLAEQGRKLTANVRAQLESIRRSSAGSPKSLVFLVGRTPGRLEGMVAVGKGSYLNELIAIAGGRNIFAGTATAYPKISLESIVRLKPDVIVDMGDMAETVGITDQYKRTVVELWKARPDVSSRVYAVADDIFVVPGPRMVDAARKFREMISARP